MSIDEAITFCNEKAINIKLKAEPKVFIQIAEWLEELKKRRSEDYGYMADIHQSIGYRKAIDDFANGIKEILDDNAIYNMDCIDTLAEQLKEYVINKQL